MELTLASSHFYVIESTSEGDSPSTLFQPFTVMQCICADQTMMGMCSSRRSNRYSSSPSWQSISLRRNDQDMSLLCLPHPPIAVNIKARHLHKFRIVQPFHASPSVYPYIFLLSRAFVCPKGFIRPKSDTREHSSSSFSDSSP